MEDSEDIGSAQHWRAGEAKRGFDQFIDEVACLLNIDTVKKLATLLNYPPADIDKAERDSYPGYVFVKSLREKGIINSTDISTLSETLIAIDLRGIANEVIECFRRNLSDTHSLPGSCSILPAKVQTFLEEIKLKYQDLCNSVKPIPYHTDEMVCVDKVFVDSGIEFLAHKLWERLDSYHCILTDRRLASNRFILFGEPGFGKSMLALQLAFDWYSRCPESPLRNRDIFIYLPLREVRGVNSIFTAIKRYLLPRESKLMVEDIRDILSGSRSVAFVFDGYNEYVQMNDSDDDVTHIVSGRMFNTSLVILTTRPSCEPLQPTSTTIKLRLLGFDSDTQYKYIRKTFGNDTKTTDNITLRFEGNPVLRDLCQVPLFFVLLTHVTHEKEEPINFDSVTKLFHYVIACFHERMKNKLADSSMRLEYEKMERDHYKLDKVAFKSCLRKKKPMVWKKDEFKERIGFSLYEKYIEAGILIEEETLNVNDGPGTRNLIKREKQVRFFHEVFRDWYAAHYLSSYVEKRFTIELKYRLKKIDAFESQYVFRFACGINPRASSKIINYLQNVDGGNKFAVLCILEQTGSIDNIRGSIQQLCWNGVIISGYDSLLFQRSSMQLVEIAAKHDIPIEYVELYNCIHYVESVDETKAVIKTTSELTLSSQIPVKRLTVSFFHREVTETEAILILDFCSKCSSLHVACFRGSVPPHSFEVGPMLSRLKSHNVTVKYSGVYVESSEYILNTTTGQWEREENGEKCTDEDFQKMRSEWDEVKDVTEETHRSNVKKARESLRKDAGSKLDGVKGEDDKMLTKA